MDLRKKINDFIEEYRNVSDGSAVYNEFSLQHELGFFLRRRLKGEGYKVEFERNVSFFGIINGNGNKLTKHEIDISIYKKDAVSRKHVLLRQGHKIYGGIKRKRL